MATEVITGSRKSVKLTKDELRLLKEYRKKFDTEVECAISIGIDRLVLNRVLLVGSGSQVTIDKIRKAIGKNEQTINKETIAGK